jgi:hypothetical protein
MRRALVIAVGALLVATFMSSRIAAAATRPANCAASTAERCTQPTKAQIRAAQNARHDAERACTSVNLLVAQTHVNEAVDPSSLADAIGRLSRTQRYGPLAPSRLLREAKKIGTPSEELISLTPLQAWCGDLGVPA